MAKNILLLFLIVIIAALGAVWFDYLGVIDIKTLLSPAYRALGFEGRSQPASEKNEVLNLDAERLAVRLEALNLQSEEMATQEALIAQKKAEVEQMAAELEDRQKGLDEREKSMNESASADEARSKNIEQNARYLNGMDPARAVAIIAQMDDQDAIDVLRKTEEIAQAEGTASIVSYWFSLMQPERAATLQRKMAARP